MTLRDYGRALILMGYVAARLADLQFERAAFMASCGIALLIIFHYLDRRFIYNRS